MKTPNSEDKLQLGDTWKFQSKDPEVLDFTFVICGDQDDTIDIFIPEDQSLKRIKKRELKKAKRIPREK